MTDKYEDLPQRYPLLFGGKEYFYFECDKGWYDLINGLCASLEKEIAKQEEKDLMFVVQIKEKFGGLRFYMSSLTEDISNMIDAAEKESYKICEACSSREEVTTQGRWMKTYCSKCRNKNDQKS